MHPFRWKYLIFANILVTIENSVSWLSAFLEISMRQTTLLTMPTYPRQPLAVKMSPKLKMLISLISVTFENSASCLSAKLEILTRQTTLLTMSTYPRQPLATKMCLNIEKVNFANISVTIKNSASWLSTKLEISTRQTILLTMSNRLQQPLMVQMKS